MLIFDDGSIDCLPLKLFKDYHSAYKELYRKVNRIKKWGDHNE